jgi:hypothetical protein
MKVGTVCCFSTVFSVRSTGPKPSMLLECYLSKRAKWESIPSGHLPINPSEARGPVSNTDRLPNYSQATKGNLHYYCIINTPYNSFWRPHLVKVFYTTEFSGAIVDTDGDTGGLARRAWHISSVSSYPGVGTSRIKNKTEALIPNLGY